ncbi:iron only hydrogenase large subunit-like protein [Lachnotalea glycerini]|uniref:Histidine kinase n=1 Tax=Lachnotalea glycerini TaxID=1763509 RepID=A0A255I1Q4_9FIRM|nr:[Fe-Fe] hydrogenase large subunit C-terminal domain-containing protein [Lachnotalea glycerini]PXV93829.1 iron only hydrogenase large subunit-like protein [Lachnotalea glycerini]RDY30931.1 histidine kinase [Lachnotalea glycerini]
MNDYLKFKKSNCKNCYRCIRHCPVKSIRFSDNQANIISQDCILCGHCFLNCPQNAKEIRNDIEKAKAIIKSNVPVYASIAPSFVANYDNATIFSMEKALKQLGFLGVEETSIGATIVKKQYEDLISEEKQEVIISSCCHTVNLLIQKYYPEALPYLAKVVSPMQAHNNDIKRRFKGAKTIFIGPCLSKKAEAESYKDGVDCVLTFEELSAWLEEENIQLEYIQDTHEKGLARLFPTTGGILKTLTVKKPEYSYIAIDGIENCMNALKDVINGKLGKCFIEMSSCIGSCIGGPAMDKSHRSPIKDFLRVHDYAKEEDFDIFDYTENELNVNFSSLAGSSLVFDDAAIEEVLKQMGKTKPEHELNCGSCGYNSCRDKAKAVLEGKANIGMCLPYLKEKAESFSDNIISNTPNAILVLNEELKVQQINHAACDLLNIATATDILGDHVVRILDPFPFFEAYENGKNTYDKREYFAEYRKYVEQTVIYDRSYHILICIMRDITEESRQRQQKEITRQKTIEITNNVIEKQMRAVQEIASLLGETTAETKVALTKLKESLYDE